MIRNALLFLFLTALVAGILGYFGMAGTAFYIAGILAAVSLVRAAVLRLRSRNPKHAEPAARHP